MSTTIKNGAYFLLTLCMAMSCARYETNDFNRFTGRWTLHVVESLSDSTGVWTPREDHYKNRQGFIMYDGLGGMGVHHVPDNFETYQYEGNSLKTLSETDLRHLSNNFVYFGKYNVIDSEKIIEHHIESAGYPHMWGTTARRKYMFEGDTLTLYPVRDGYPKTRLKWVKIDDSDAS